MLRSLNPEFRHDVVPGLTKPYAIRLPLADTGRFIDQEDSIYAYRADELLNKRIEVTINDDVPTYTRKKTRAAGIQGLRAINVSSGTVGRQPPNGGPRPNGPRLSERPPSEPPASPGRPRKRPHVGGGGNDYG